MKYAVYVEGQSELLFVADILRKYSNYDPSICGLRCINLNADDFERMNHPIQGDESSKSFYQIVNVNNDNRVVSKLNKDIPGLLVQGYNVIIGLKDVFSDAYKSLTNDQPVIEREQIEKMHGIQTKAIKAPDGIDCRLHFAIMEYETWMLALLDNFVTSNGKDLTEICHQLGVDLAIDYEQVIYHPYPLVRKIFQTCGSDYHKHGGESFSFLSTLTIDDYEKLRFSGRCVSFAKFLDSLLGGPRPPLP